MISKNIVKLFTALHSDKKKREEMAAYSEKIKVNTMISKLGFMYEKIRNTLEYNDEHLVRKHSIERILKRRLVDSATGHDITRFLINDLIRGGYIENNSLPETKIFEVSQIINKYIVLINRAFPSVLEKSHKLVYDWVFSLLACEVEACLVYSAVEDAYMEFFYRSVSGRILLKDETFLSKSDFDIQLYITIARLITFSDDSMVSYRLFMLQHPEWASPKKEDIEKFASELWVIKSDLDRHLNHVAGKILLKQLRPISVNIKILRQVIEVNRETIDDIIVKPDSLSVELRKICDSVYKKIRGKVRRSVIRSIIYLFITKMLLAFLIEMPFDLYVLGYIAYIPLYVNIIFPPCLLFLITMSARLPNDVNTDKILQGVRELVYDENANNQLFELKNTRSQSSLLYTLFRGVYALTFFISYGLIIWGLYVFEFNLVSGGLFLLFLSLVSYFGIHIRRIAREFLVIGRKENILTFILDMFSYPIIRVGQWISDKSSKINIFIFILDVLIEAPFKTLLEIFDQWSLFIKDKKDEIYE